MNAFLIFFLISFQVKLHCFFSTASVPTSQKLLYHTIKKALFSIPFYISNFPQTLLSNLSFLDLLLLPVNLQLQRSHPFSFIYLHWFTKKIKLEVVHIFLTELGAFCTTESKSETHFSQSGQVFF